MRRNHGRVGASSSLAPEVATVLPQNASLMEKLDFGHGFVSPLAPRRDEPSVETKVAKAIQINFPDWTKAHIDVIQKNTFTLRETITRDMLNMAEPESPRAQGKQYYQQFQEAFDVEAIAASMKVNDDGLLLDEELKMLLLAFCRSSSQVDPLTQWFEVTTNVNRKNFVAVCRALLPIDPGQNDALAKLVCDFMQMIVRLKLGERFSAEICVMKGHFDRALQKTLWKIRSQGIRSQLWWDSVKQYADLVLPKQAVDKIFDCTSDWKDVSNELTLVMKSSGVGRVLVGEARKAMESKIVEDGIKKHIDLLLAKDITQDSVAAVRAAFQTELKSVLGVAAQTPQRWTANVVYRGVDVLVHCNSLLEVFNMAVAATIRTECVNLKVVQPMLCEDDLVNYTIPRVKHVDAALGIPTSCARSVLKDCTSTIEPSSLKAVLKTNQESMLSLDPKFIIELGFWYRALVELKTGKVHEAILKCYVQNNGQPTTIGFSKANLVALGRSRFFKWCGKESFFLLSLCKELADDIIAGVAPNVKTLGESEFAKKLLFAMARTLKAVVTPDITMYAYDAVRAKLIEMDADMVDNRITYLSLRWSRQYAWLLTKDEAKRVEAVTAQVLAMKRADDLNEHKLWQAIVASKDPEPKAKKAKKSIVGDDATLVDKLFG